jgi:hypothetical protein
LLLLLTALGLLAENRATAENIDFSYSWSMPSTIILPNPPGAGSIIFSLDQGGTKTVELGGTTPLILPAATISTNTSATNPADVFDTTFGMTLHLTEGNITKDLTFSGTLIGKLTGTTSTVEAQFTGDLTQKATINNHDYVVTIEPAIVLIPSPIDPSALIDAQISVGGSTPVPTVPEPSSLMLGATAIAGFAARRWWRKTRPS